jgi:spermidine/putrescine transport system permease protein
VLATVTVLYLLWSLLPVLIAVLFSFNAGRSRSVWQGFSLRWYTGDPNLSVLHDSALRASLGHTLLLGVLTTLVAVPLGVSFALGLDRWHGRLPSTANAVVVLSFVIPEIVLATGVLFMITQLQVPFQLGTTAQVVGLVTFQVSYPVIIVRARLLTIGRHYEEAARDLGASPLQAVRRILLPMLRPAVFASAVLVFADVIDDFVLVRYLSASSQTETSSMKIYNTARAAPTPALNALATIMLVASFAAVLIGWLAYRRLTRGEKETTGLANFAQL